MKRVDIDFKKRFNLGYELAEELDLKSSMFENEKDFPSNSIHAGMMQYINEINLSKSKNLNALNIHPKNKNEGMSL